MGADPAGLRVAARGVLGAIALGCFQAGAQVPVQAPVQVPMQMPMQEQAAPPRIAPTGQVWSAGAGFAFEHQPKKLRRSVSGIACARNAAQARVCLVAFDEGMQARFAELEEGRLMPLRGGVRFAVPGKELDAEAAATDGRFFYVTGSHAVKRGDCSANDSSRHVLRFPRDAVTGLVATAPQGGSTPAGDAQSARLPALLAGHALLGDSLAAGRCLGTGALDIEALAVRNGRLYFGLRGPTAAGHAFIVSVDADAFFDGGDARLSVTRVWVGERRGLRDMAVTAQGILLLAGPDDDPRSHDAGWTLLLWDAQQHGAAWAQPRLLAALDLRGVARRACDKETKPEALTVLDESPRRLRVLVLSDGMCDGGALVFDVPT